MQVSMQAFANTGLDDFVSLKYDNRIPVSAGNHQLG